MQLNVRTLEKLREIINETSEHRSGPKLVAFFNELGFNDTYAQGFPSRWFYTDTKLQQINGKPELYKCLKNVFAVINYVGRVEELDALIADFNQYMAFDKWVMHKQDVKKFSHVVIGFRNYIHPYEQMSSRFIPDRHTALICLQVLKAAIHQIGNFRKSIKEGTTQ
jgi:hypothetical protein